MQWQPTQAVPSLYVTVLWVDLSGLSVLNIQLIVSGDSFLPSACMFVHFSHAFAELQCPRPALPFGQISPATGPINTSVVLQYSCNTGFALIGTTIGRCLQSGQIDDVPLCLGTPANLHSNAYPDT